MTIRDEKLREKELNKQNYQEEQLNSKELRKDTSKTQQERSLLEKKSDKNEKRPFSVAKAICDSVHISPQKSRLVADLIRRAKKKQPLSALYCLALLSLSSKKAARIIYKLLASAISNATSNFDVEKKDLVVSSIYVDLKSIQKRIMPRARGQADEIKKRYSRIEIQLGRKK